MSRASDRVACVLALALGLAGSIAAAEPTAADRETARQLYYDGDRLRLEGNHQGALRAFVAAHAIMRAPTTGVEVGRTLLRLGRLVEALDHFVQVTRHPPTSDEPPEFTEARLEAKTLAAELRTRIPTLTVELSGAEDDATVSIDGELLERASLGLPRVLDPGSHVVVAVSHGHRRETRVRLAEREHETVRLAFPPPARADRIAPAALDEGPGPWPWIFVGVGAASVVAGAITGGFAIARADALAPRCPGRACGPEHHDALDRATALAHASTVTLAFGAAAVVTGGILYWALDESTAVSATAGPQGGGAALGARF